MINNEPDYMTSINFITNSISQLETELPHLILMCGDFSVGKSFIANNLKTRFEEMGRHTFVVSLDNIRSSYTDAETIEIKTIYDAVNNKIEELIKEGISHKDGRIIIYDAINYRRRWRKRYIDLVKDLEAGGCFCVFVDSASSLSTPEEFAKALNSKAFGDLYHKNYAPSSIEGFNAIFNVGAVRKPQHG